MFGAVLDSCRPCGTDDAFARRSWNFTPIDDRDLRPFFVMERVFPTPPKPSIWWGVGKERPEARTPLQPVSSAYLDYVSDDVWQVFRGDRWGRGDKEQAQTPERGLHWSLSMNISAPFFFSTLLPSNPSAATCRWATRLTSLSHTCRVRGTSGYRYLRMLRCRSGSATLRTVMLNLPCHLGEIWSADRATVYPHYTKHLTVPA